MKIFCRAGVVGDILLIIRESGAKGTNFSLCYEKDESIIVADVLSEDTKKRVMELAERIEEP